MTPENVLAFVNEAIDSVCDDPERRGSVVMPRFAFALLLEATGRLNEANDERPGDRWMKGKEEGKV